MKDLFGNEIQKHTCIRYRDALGRFSDKKTSEFELTKRMNKGLKDYTNYLINIIDNQRIQLRIKEEQINGFKRSNI